MVPADLARLRVLIADDEPKLRALLSGAFRALGCTVVEARDGREAWQLAQGRHFDVVVLDVMMPAMSGWEVCRRIKTDPTAAGAAQGPTKVLMLTGIGEHLNEMTSPLFAADDWIDKPFSLKQIAQKVLALAGVEGVDVSAQTFGEMVTEPGDTDPVVLRRPGTRPPTPPGPALRKARPARSAGAGGGREVETVESSPSRRQRAAKKSSPRQRAAKKPAAKKPAAKKPAAKKPAAKKPAAKKPAAKKPAAKKPAAKKRAPRRHRP